MTRRVFTFEAPCKPMGAEYWETSLFPAHGGTCVANVYAPTREASLERATLFIAAPHLRDALKEIVTICKESRSDCRKRMGTRLGNVIAEAESALKLLEGAL